jgi:hypothetical protein
MCTIAGSVPSKNFAFICIYVYVREVCAAAALATSSANLGTCVPGTPSNFWVYYSAATAILSAGVGTYISSNGGNALLLAASAAERNAGMLNPGSITGRNVAPTGPVGAVIVSLQGVLQPRYAVVGFSNFITSIKYTNIRVIPCPPNYGSALTPSGYAGCTCEAAEGQYCGINGLVQTCPAGSYCYGLYNTWYTPCPAGSWSEIGNSNPKCTPCLAGTYGPTTGLTACLNCLVGNYCPFENMTSVVPCPAGNYCPVASLDSVVPCAVGMYQLNTGSTSCIYCPVGTYQDNPTVGATSCPACAAGSYNPSTGMTTVTACVTCPVGTWQPNTGSSACIICPGRYVVQTEYTDFA